MAEKNFFLRPLAAGLLLFNTFLHTSPTPLPVRGLDDELADIALANVYKILDGTLSDGSNHTSGCTKETVVVRKEFGDLTSQERIEYTTAVNCLLTSPSKLNPIDYPGAKNRYDDFVVVHMNMTPSVHSTFNKANFMHWHRYYIWAYEYALRNECGYEGYQPYWNWGKYEDPNTSPIFSGEDDSMSGNGEPVPHKGRELGTAHVEVPAGPGGGCVQSGPFKNMSINLGPLSPTMDPALGIPPNPRSDGYGYNPRCLRRDVSNYFTSQYLRPIDISNHIQSTSDIDVFQTTLQNDRKEAFSLHVGGHYTIWGDPGGDVFVSPAEPVFWLHHTQLDRHWWIWQNQDPENRVQQYKGGTNWQNPDSPRGNIDDIQELSVVKPEDIADQPSRNLVSSTGGPILCYIYE